MKSRLERFMEQRELELKATVTKSQLEQFGMILMTSDISQIDSFLSENCLSLDDIFYPFYGEPELFDNEEELGSFYDELPIMAAVDHGYINVLTHFSVTEPDLILGFLCATTTQCNPHTKTFVEAPSYYPLKKVIRNEVWDDVTKKSVLKGLVSLLPEQEYQQAKTTLLYPFTKDMIPSDDDKEKKQLIEDTFKEMGVDQQESHTHSARYRKVGKVGDKLIVEPVL